MKYSNYPPGVTGREPQIAGDYELETISNSDWNLLYNQYMSEINRLWNFYDVENIEVSFRSDGNAAHNIKMHHLPFSDASISEADSEYIYETIAAAFIDKIENIAISLGYRSISIVGRSGGWLVCEPTFTYEDAVVSAIDVKYRIDVFKYKLIEAAVKNLKQIVQNNYAKIKSTEEAEIFSAALKDS